MRRAIALSLGVLAAIALSHDSRAQKPHAPTAVRPAPRPTYANFVQSWHAPVDGRTTPVDANARPMLALFAINTNERVELSALDDNGGFAAHDLDRAAHLLRDPRAGNEHPIEPRLLDAIYRIERKFGAQEIRVISAYRTPRAGGGSNHGKGRAIDLVVPGTSDEDVAKFARDMGFMGVGVYPVSGFVHVDVRDRSYFWLDSSAPGKKNRERGVLGDQAQRADAAALARGERGIPSLTVATDVDAALQTRTASLITAAPPDEDDDDWSP
jgi:uncharacterized protein YcbK (DUF882 family)